MQKSTSVLTQASLTAVLTILPALVLAHPDHSLAVQDMTVLQAISAGMAHPFSGADHLVLAAGLGMLMAYFAKNHLKMLYFGAGIFAISLAIGFVLALTGQFSAWGATENLMELGILSSVLVVAVAVMGQQFSNGLQKKLPQTGAVAAIVLATFHGAAHAFEMPDNVSMQGFGGGMVTSMLMVYAIGAYFIFQLERLSNRQPILRFTPIFVAILGVIMVFG